jgi:hypothetical protein
MGFDIIEMSGGNGGAGSAGMSTGPLGGSIIRVGEPMPLHEYRMGQATDTSNEIKSRLQVLEDRLHEANQKLQEANERIAALEDESVPMVEIIRRLEDLEIFKRSLRG